MYTETHQPLLPKEQNTWGKPSLTVTPSQKKEEEEKKERRQSILLSLTYII